mmetsp:Transcript_24227/g.31643  ORF Transcript_24227/g.31643 Transcript_24227/m.31643 type:complete len:194 (-) Transcript_24227:1230-1811(-)
MGSEGLIDTGQKSAGDGVALLHCQGDRSDAQHDAQLVRPICSLFVSVQKLLLLYQAQMMNQVHSKKQEESYAGPSFLSEVVVADIDSIVDSHMVFGQKNQVAFVGDAVAGDSKTEKIHESFLVGEHSLVDLGNDLVQVDVEYIVGSSVHVAVDFVADLSVGFEGGMVIGWIGQQVVAEYVVGSSVQAVNFVAG